uniref:Putative signal transducer n=1 Tax=Moniliophthora roreri TaxID=221103 RepID=A0A0W0FB07_MONRR
MQKNDKVFRIARLNSHTFFTSSDCLANQTGAVTCSTLLKSVDRRPVIAVGCDGGVWVGFQDDPKCRSTFTETGTLNNNLIHGVSSNASSYSSEKGHGMCDVE